MKKKCKHCGKFNEYIDSLETKLVVEESMRKDIISALEKATEIMKNSETMS